MFTALWDVIVGILVPAGGLTPVSIVAWFGLLVGPLSYSLGFLKRLARGR